MKRLYLVGVDSLPLWILKELSKKHNLGAFNRLVDTNRTTEIKSTLPPLTGPGWPSIYTGLTPGEHGVPDFFVMKKNYTPDIVYYDSKKTPPFWKRLAQSGKKCLIVTPATEITLPDYANVDMITGFPLPSKTNSKELQKLMDSYNFHGEPDVEKEMKAGKLSEKDAVHHYLESINARATIAKRMLAKKKYDFVYVCFTETDRIQHFVLGKKERDEYLVPVYRAIGDFISYILARVDKEDAAFAIVSDHGAQAIKSKFLLNAWLVENGYLKLKPAVAAKMAEAKSRGGMRYSLREQLMRNSALRKSYDALPYGIKRIAFKSFGAVFSGASPGESRLHLFDFDMRHSKAFAAISNNPVATIWINDERFTEGIVSKKDKERIKEELNKKLSEVRSPEKDRLFAQIYDGDSYYKGTKKFIAPDLLAQAKDGYTIDIFNFSRSTFYSRPEGAKSGDHILYGVFGFYSKKKVEIRNLQLEDVSGIILDYFGLKGMH